MSEYVRCMGNELGETYFHLQHKLIELHIVWLQYRQLFAERSTVELLNRTAGLFFKVVQDELWDSVLLRISKLTDPPSSAGRRNLTIQRLAPLIIDNDLQGEIDAMTKHVIATASFAREHRNKRIAHLDHSYSTMPETNPLTGVSRAQIENVLHLLRDLMNRVDARYRDSTYMYEQFVDETGARLLLQKLHRAELAAL